MVITGFNLGVWVMVDKESKIGVIGVGGIHHVAFDVLDESDLEEMVDHLNLQMRPPLVLSIRFHAFMYFRTQIISCLRLQR